MKGITALHALVKTKHRSHGHWWNHIVKLTQIQLKPGSPFRKLKTQVNAHTRRHSNETRQNTTTKRHLGATHYSNICFPISLLMLDITDIWIMSGTKVSCVLVFCLASLDCLLLCAFTWVFNFLNGLPGLNSICVSFIIWFHQCPWLLCLVLSNACNSMMPFLYLLACYFSLFELSWFQSCCW